MATVEKIVNFVSYFNNALTITLGCVLNEDQFQIHCPRHKDTAALLA